MADGLYTNLPVADAEVEIYEVDPKTGERKTPQPVHRKTTGADGQWGPFIGSSDACYEFVLRMAGQPITHTYRSPFLRSSDVVHLRPEPFAKADETRGRGRGHEPAARLFRRRPRQVLARRQGAARHHRRRAGGRRPAGSPSTPAPRTVLAVFNNETIAARTWPAKDNHIVVAEFLN